MHTMTHMQPPMSSHMPTHMVSHMPSHMMFPSVLKTLQYCAAVCEQMTNLLLCKKDVHCRTTQLQLLRDCADICETTMKFIARNSPYSRALAQFCAQVCEVCGNECLKFPDPESQMCARVCLQCAEECRAFAMSA